MTNDLLLYGALVAVATSAAMFTYLVMSTGAAGELLMAGAGRRSQIDNPVMRLVLPIARALSPIHRGAEETASGRELDRKLRQAGRPYGMTVAEFLCLRYVGALIGLVIGYMLATQLSDDPNPLIVLALGAFGFFYPKMRLSTVAERRRVRIFRDMPYVIDLLTLSTEAGQDFSSAMALVVEKGPPGPLIDEFRIAQQSVTLGKTRSDALREMAERIDLTELTSFVLALIQAEQLGAGIGKVLRVMGEQMRVKRWNMAEETAGKVPVKLMAPLVMCIFPASFIVLFVPIYLRTMLGEGM
jgi:tight adherence protein C